MTAIIAYSAIASIEKSRNFDDSLMLPKLPIWRGKRIVFEKKRHCDRLRLEWARPTCARVFSVLDVSLSGAE